ncbi:MFS transporter [Sphingobium chlorophenolicum]|uniref:MFS transporter n=1 Tax=Sphingobium chlorophenolicum TaxID=46429 RepID=UPI0009EED6E6|nr:MFS transporter [Sphingobium chlorophenolicum]
MKFTKTRPVSPDRTAATARLMVVILCLGQMLNYFDRSVVGLAATDIMRDLALTTADYGLLSGAFFGLYGLSGVVVGLTLSHRVRPRVLLTVMIAVWTITQFPIAIAPSLMMLMICRALLGAAESPSISTSVAAAHEWFPADRRSIPTAFIMIGPLLGSIVAPPILTTVMGAYGWKAGFVTCGLFSGLMLATLLAFGRDGPGMAIATPASPRSDHPRTVNRLWSDPAIIAVTAAGFSTYWVMSFAVAWLFPMLELGLGYDRVTASWLGSGVYILGAVLLLAASALSQALLKRGLNFRRAVVWPMLTCLVIGISAFLAAVAAPTNSMRFCLLAIAIAAGQPVTSAVPIIISAIAPLELRNRMLVVLLSLTSMAGMASPYLTGLLIDRQGFAGFVPAILLCAAVLLCGMLITLAFLHPDAAIKRIASRSRIVETEPRQALT